MHPGRRVRLQSLAGIALAALLFVLAVMFADHALRGYRLDVTEHRLYTISEHTQSILDEIEYPVTLTLYFSYEASEGVPYVREYARRVEELLESYVARSGGRIRLRVVDPRPLTEARERAEEHGLEAVPAGQGQELFLGLVGTNTVDGLETIDFFEPERERFLEYDISRLIWALNRPDRPVVGLLSRLPLTDRVDPGTGQLRDGWTIVDRLESIVELRTMQHPVHRIDDDIDVLMLVHPRRYDDRTLYAIDQYLMRGGRAVLFIDPVADSDSRQRERDGEVERHVSTSDPGRLLAGWGIDVTLDQALADPRHGLIVTGGDGEHTVHPGMIGIEGQGMHPDDAVTAMVDRVVFGSPGSIGVIEGGPHLQPLVRTPVTTALVPVEQFVGFRRPAEIVRGFRHDGEQHTVAARASGPMRSAWPDGPPAASQAPADEHRAGTDNVNMILFSDTDLLTDDLWIRTERARDGRMVRRPWTDNGDLVANAIENMAGSDALIAIRGRGTSARPFTRVQALEREAAARYRETEEALRSELEEIEERLQALRAGAEDASVILTDEERRELEASRERRAELRMEVRRVQQQLDAEINALGARLRLLNIVAVPLLVVAGAVTVFVLRRRRRRRHVA